MRHLIVALVSLLSILSCYATSPPGSSSRAPLSTLYVENETGGIVDVYIVPSGFKVGSVVGPEGCIYINEVHRNARGFLFQPTAEPLYPSPEVGSIGSSSWSIRLGPWPNTRSQDMQSFTPYSGRCFKRGDVPK